MDKDSLVEQIKNIQRSDFGAKQAWWDYCDQNFGGIKDPNKHDVTVLNTFLVGFRTGAIKPVATAVPSFSKGAGKGAMPGTPGDFMAAMAKWMATSGGGGGGPAAVSASGGDSALQDFVKLGQRSSISWKQAWQSYCTLNGNQRFDPAKYDRAYIVGFIDYLGQVANEDLNVAAAGQGITLEQAPLLVGHKRALGYGDEAPAPKRFNAGTGAAAFTATGGSDPLKASLVDRVKTLQRSNEAAKAAWGQYCLEQLGGVKDPNRHDALALQTFLDTFGG